LDITTPPELGYHSKTKYTQDIASNIYDRFFGISNELAGSVFYLKVIQGQDLDFYQKILKVDDAK